MGYFVIKINKRLITDVCETGRLMTNDWWYLATANWSAVFMVTIPSNNWTARETPVETAWPHFRWYLALYYMQ